MPRHEPSEEALSVEETTLVDGQDGSSEEYALRPPPSASQLIKKQLCPTCKDLKLSVDRFIISSNAETGRKHDYSTFPLQSSTNTHRLGSLKDIRERAYSGCPFCNLVNNSVQDSSNVNERRLDFPSDYLDTACVANWEIDGRDVLNTKQKAAAGSERNSVRGRTRRIHLRWDGGQIKDSYLVFMPAEKYSVTTSDAQRVWGKESLFLGRKVNILGDNQALVKSWLDLCWQKHRGPCKLSNEVSANKFLEMISHSYFGVVDVINMQLVELPFATIPEMETRDRGYEEEHVSSEYDTASNSWGSSHGSASPPYRDERREARQPYRPPPHPARQGRRRRRETYRSSRPMVGVTHAPFVALSYVWENPASFKCIKKNVPLLRTHGGIEKVLPQLPKAIRDAMDLVRRLGLQYIWIDRLCIVQDSLQSWKLNAFNMDLIYGNATLTICAADGDARVGLKAMSKEHSNVQVKETCAPGVSLMVTRPPEIYIKKSTWNTRAWTFQERLLSRRCLIFTEGRVYFQCQSTGMSEDIYADREGAGWSLDFVDAPLQLFRQLSQRAFFVYMKLLERYSAREMTKPKDILAAYSGISNLMEQKTNSKFVFGLPSSHFDIALLWEPLAVGRRRNGTTEEEIDEMGSFPSWSWSGWIGTTMAYKDEMIGGCLDNLEEWLEKYTWIKWFVRDGHGDLRPLWDNTLSKMDRSTERRWRGYKSGRAAEKNKSKGRRSKMERNRESATRGLENLRGERAPYVVVMDDDMNTRQNDIRHFHDETRRREERDHYDEDEYIVRTRTPPRGVRIIERTRSRDHVRRNRGSEPQYYGEGTRGAHGEPAAIIINNRIYNDDRAQQPPSPPAPLNPYHNSEFFDMAFSHDKEVRPEDVDADPTFHITMREYPYRVVVAPYDPEPVNPEFPLLPVLQFWTWHTTLHIRRADMPTPSITSNTASPSSPDTSNDVGEGLARCHIADAIGDWCGSIVVDSTWISTQTSSKQEFIALSIAKNFTEKECATWSYYIPKEREASEWDLYFVMLVERVEERWERRGVGKCFREAWRGAGWKEIMLG